MDTHTVWSARQVLRCAYSLSDAQCLTLAAPLFLEHGLPLPSLDPSTLLSLLLVVDPHPLLSGRDRLPWLLNVLPLASAFALALSDHLA